MESNDTSHVDEALPLFEHDLLLAQSRERAEPATGSQQLFEPTAHGHLRLRADSPQQLRERIGPALEYIAERKAMQGRLQDLGLDHHRLPCSILVTGGRGTGKRTIAQRFQDTLRAKQPEMSPHMVEVPGGLLSSHNLAKRPRDVWCVNRLDLLANDNHLDSVVAVLEQQKEEATLAFVGTPAEAERLLTRAPNISKILALEIPLPNYTPDELFRIFEDQFRNRGQHLTSKAHARAQGYFTSRALLSSQGTPTAHDAVNFASQVASAQYHRLHGRPDNNLAVEVREILGSDVEQCLADVSTTPASSAQEQLDALVGLDGVKKQIAAVGALAAVNARRKQAGLPTVGSSMHMAFLGAPGTGKTEAARIVARLLHETGAVSHGHLVERSRHNLVGKHIGETAILVQKAVDEARGGVLFIDEAYTLAPTSERDFGHEAIATLIQAMENYRDDLVVILAGYGHEMEALFQTNPGFSSRVGTRIEFPDYSELELLDIFRTLAGTHHMRLGQGVAEQVLALAGHAVSQPGFGNARWVRNLFESAVLRQAVRLGSSAGDLNELLIDDLTAADPY